MNRLHAIAEEAAKGIEGLLATPLTEDQTEKVTNIIEQATAKAVREWQRQAVDVARQFPEGERKTAHKVALIIGKNYDALIANLSSMR